LLAHLRNLFSLFERMVLDMEAFREGTQGCIRIQAHMSAASSVFPRLLARFLDRNPGIDVDVREHISLDVVHALQTAAQGYAEKDITDDEGRSADRPHDGVSGAELAFDVRYQD